MSTQKRVMSERFPAWRVAAASGAIRLLFSIESWALNDFENMRSYLYTRIGDEVQQALELKKDKEALARAAAIECVSTVNGTLKQHVDKRLSLLRALKRRLQIDSTTLGHMVFKEHVIQLLADKVQLDRVGIANVYEVNFPVVRSPKAFMTMYRNLENPRSRSSV